MQRQPVLRQTNCGSVTVAESGPGEPVIGQDVYVDSCDLQTSEVGVGDTVTVDYRIQNDFDVGVNVTLELLINGSAEATDSVFIAPGFRRHESFQVTFDSPGDYQTQLNIVSAGAE